MEPGGELVDWCSNYKLENESTSFFLAKDLYAVLETMKSGSMLASLICR